MYVKVRTMDGTENAILTISKLTSVEDFRILVEGKFDVPPERQRLFYRGKQMEDGHNMFDYNVNINDVIQLMVKPVLTEVPQNSEKVSKSKPASQNHEEKENHKNADDALNIEHEQKSEYYLVGDLVDAQCLFDGTWWEAKITRISVNPLNKKGSLLDDGLFYSVKYERYEDYPEDELKLEHIRPRAKTKISVHKLKPGHVVMVNYNLEHPEQRGYWYDCKISKVINTRSKKTVIATLYTAGKCTIEECHIKILDEIFRIEKNIPLVKKSHLVDNDVPECRSSAPKCTTCKDNPKRKCKECGCHECGGKENPGQQLMCDECDQPFHIYCLDPPLENIPDVEEWFCPLCKNDDSEVVKAGEKLRTSRKKSKMASAKNNTSRDWGKGLACAGRQKVCNIVSQNHFGPIPGVEVGSMWKFRLQASEAGVHRPHVAGIHGRENEGSYSIVLAGGYEDDEDDGEEFTYTGSGGRDLSGNKRTAEQSSDQTLTRMNRALALNCNVPINKKGAEASDWREGKPVRVLRSYKGKRHSKYAPEDGIRYDGVYKIVKYWQESGKSGFKVWRYLLRRDDEHPAPWTKEGKKRSMELGLTMQFPDGYLEAIKQKEEESSFIVSDEEEEGRRSSKGRKRKALTNKNEQKPSSPKKCKLVAYQVDDELKEFIKNDSCNKKLWNECLKSTTEGKLKFFAVVEDTFSCICCQILVHNPVTTSCSHNVCQSCLHRSFKADVFTCPSCRHDLGRHYNIEVNETLKCALLNLFPGYNAGR